MLWQIDDFGELTPPDQDTLSSSEDQIPGGSHAGIFEVQAIRAKLPLANAGIDSMPATVVAAFLKRLKLGIAFVLDFTLRWSCLIRLLRH